MSDTVNGPRKGGFIPRRLRNLISDQGVRARTFRGSVWTLAAYGSAQGMRLASNLVLTRLLFPEAFGMMAIVQVFISGLTLFSDTGTRISIVQNARGDDRDFLDTAWTIQVGRGVMLWLGACALALPAAAIYDEAMLAQLLPVAALSALIAGFHPTAVHTANRHLKFGRVTLIGLSGQAVGIVAMIILAWLLESVWALVIGSLFGASLKLILYRRALPDAGNRFRWEPTAAREMFHFGKYIFASTAFGFLIQHADRAILGGYISMAELGVYNVGFFLASVPFTVAQALRTKVLLPLYRMRPMAGSDANRRKIFRVRRLMLAGALAGNAILGLGGVVIVELLYDPRYIMAGPIMVLMSLVFVPRIMVVGSGEVMLANGDSRRFLILQGSLAIAQTALLFIGISYLGMLGAILAPGLAVLITLPLRIHYARRYEAWDMWGEALFFVAGAAVGAFACWLHWDEILTRLG